MTDLARELEALRGVHCVSLLEPELHPGIHVHATLDHVPTIPDAKQACGRIERALPIHADKHVALDKAKRWGEQERNSAQKPWIETKKDIPAEPNKHNDS